MSHQIFEVLVAHFCTYRSASAGGVATQFIVCSEGIGDTPQQADLPKAP